MDREPALQTGRTPPVTVAPKFEPHWLRSLLLVALLVALYARIAIKLVSDWIHIPDYSHGLLIPFFVAFVLYDQRKTYLSARRRPTWMGIPLVLFGLIVFLAGVFGADLFLSRVSFLLLVAGILLSLFGRILFARLTFALFILFLAIPLPALLLNHVTFPLQLFASNLASQILPLAGVPVLREGNIIQLPALPLEVAEACSGIRSLMSLFAVAVMYGYIAERGFLRRTLLALASIPIAVAANVARIVGTGLCVQYWDPQKAMGFFHEFSGWIMFLISLACLYLIHSLITTWLPSVPVQPQGVPIR